MPLLFEYDKTATVRDRESLEQLLIDLWRQRPFIDPEREGDIEIGRRYQPFLRFDGNRIKANNYVGFIQSDNEIIEIYPKVFRDISEAHERKDLMLRHIFYWFGYCRKWRFPFDYTSLDYLDIDQFPELIINLIANQFLETVSQSPLSMYQPVEEALHIPRGAINFKRYVASSLAHANYQNIDCDYEPFVFDNKVNRIIKYCTRLLINRTKFTENLRILQEVTFVLSDVADVNFTANDLQGFSINPFFSEYIKVLDSCRIVLDQHLYSSSAYNLQQWCLLFPMEYIFEDFLAGFLEKRFASAWKVEYQKSDKYVSEVPRAFQMQHDIFLTSRDRSDRKIIVDAKYKLRDHNFKSDPKKGIAQGDLYQSVTYALKRGCSEVVLAYPNLSEEIHERDRFVIESNLTSKETISVIAMEIPFWSIDNFDKLDSALASTLNKI